MRRNLRGVALAFLSALAAVGVGCTRSTPVNGGCDFTYQCETGKICRDHHCVVPEIDQGQPDASTDPNPGDAGAVDGDAGMPGADAGMSDGGADAGRVTFGPATYRRCHDDLECAVFGGNCLVELTLSRPDGLGRDRVKVSEIDPSFAPDEGVCTLPCTNDPRICESITLSGPGGQSAPFSCQVVFAAQSPYPSPAPAFPFDAQLDETALTRGVPFASVCRPPFQTSAAHAESFCAACTEDSQCSAGSACLMERGFASPPSGTCVEPCGDGGSCPFGFTCGALPGSSGGANYCVPTAGTCGRCLDEDGDLRGVGRCGALAEPNTDVDCDDHDPVAYHDHNAPNHAFPQVCGPSDVNCNGKSDDAEQLGSENHCAACGDVCIPRAGEIANAVRSCVELSGAYQCVASCSPGYADCNGDVSDGCEAQLAPTDIWAEDKDGDGRGSMSAFRYVCSGQAPAGWVQNRLDCDDNKPDVYGGSASLIAAPELCDGKDNNCNGIVDDPGQIQDEGTLCASGYSGVCSVGTKTCVRANPDAGTPASFTCTPTINPVTQANAPETCDGLDNNCNGSVDEGVDYFVDNGGTNPRGPGAPAPCPVANAQGICAQGSYACTASNGNLPDGGTYSTASWTCVGTPPEPTDPIDDLAIDSNCDGSDGNLIQAIFVRPVAGGGLLDGNDSNPGSSQQPVATLGRALQLACQSGPPCLDIYVEEGSYTSTSPIEIPTFTSSTQDIPVRIYGGFTANLTCTQVSCTLTWTRGTHRSTFIRDPGPAGSDPAWPFGHSYAAMQAASGSGQLALLLDAVDLETDAPSASSFLQHGQNAPTQVGLQCPDRGCERLTLKNVKIQVENAIPGGDGDPGAHAPTGSLNGGDGCGTSDNCSGVTSAGDWMQYSSYSQWAGDALAGKAVACPDGQQNNGGSSAAIRYSNPNGGNRLYEFHGRSGGGWYGGSGGQCYGENSQLANFTVPTSGGDGSGGWGGSISGVQRFGLSWDAAANSWVTNWNVSYFGAHYGTSGSGGGGGGGCIYHPDFFYCPCGEERGGGGGAGGCGGYAGQNGGIGGSAVGVVLVPGQTQDVTLTLPGAFEVVVGNGGKGGKGGKGGDASSGGYGGLSPSHSAFTNGGHGGDGGGGGGGAGGIGGASVGVVQRCTRSSGTQQNGCGINVPPVLLAAPGNFVTVGTAGTGGTGGTGGGKGVKPYDANRSDSSSATDGSGGTSASGGEVHSILFAQ